MCYITYVVTVIAAWEQHNIKVQCVATDEYSCLNMAVYEFLKYARGFVFDILHIKIILFYNIIKE